jgi:hypothetical protein
MLENKRTRCASYVGQKWLVPMLMACLFACDEPGVTEPPVGESYAVVDGGRGGAGLAFTGIVDLVWPGGKGAGAPDDDRIAQAEIAAFLGVPEGTPGPGNFTYRVVSADGLILHREIGVRLTWAGLEDQPVLVDGVEIQFEDDIRFIGVVVSDTKPCGGSGHGSGGGCGEEGGGCSHDDGGCSGDDGGCSHDDGTTHDGGSCGGSGGTGGHEEPGGSGGHLSGNDCRIGQYVIGWMLDGGTPARNGDRVSWKWMAWDAPKLAAIQGAIADIEAGVEGVVIPWPCKLCEKEILGGNLALNSLGR